MKDRPCHTIQALIAGVAHLLHEHAARRDCPAWLRAALTGPGESGIAAALVLAAEPKHDREAVMKLLSATERLLPAGSAARSACAALWLAYDESRGTGFRAVEAFLSRLPGAAAIMREVDGP